MTSIIGKCKISRLIQYYETTRPKKKMGAPAPAAPASLAPMVIIINQPLK